MLFNSQDSQWTEISASLRKGKLYVKMPRGKVDTLIKALFDEQKDLLKKEVLESAKSFVFYGSTDDWNEDLMTLKELNSSETVTELILAVEAGLRNEAWVDWVSRVGGPPREDLDALESLFGDNFVLN
jgi:hypothetical protein